MEFNIPLMLTGLAFSGVGFVYFSYGKKMGKIPLLVTGLGLMIYPYFVQTIAVCVAVGLLGSLLPFFMRWW